MMFLIEYDRDRGRLVRLDVYQDKELQQAEGSRFDLELKLNRRGITHEVVLLEAPSEEALRRTHRRYFEDISDLINTPQDMSLKS